MLAMMCFQHQQISDLHEKLSGVEGQLAHLHHCGHWQARLYLFIGLFVCFLNCRLLFVCLFPAGPAGPVCSAMPGPGP